jgi:transposase
MVRRRPTNRRFSAEFKAAAVERARSALRNGGTASSVARELDIDAGLLSAWMRVAVPDTSSTAAETPVEELRRLRRENETLRMEVEFAKKAAAYFAKDVR